MSLSSRIWTWWRAISRSAEVQAQAEEELRFHVERYTEDLMRGGLAREEAMRRARAELGSLPAARENARQAWGTRWLDEMRGDLRYALRMLARSPGFTSIAIGSLALGIGANTVIFSAAQHMLLDRLQVPHPEQLKLLAWSEPQDGVVEEMWGFFDDLPGGGQISTSFSYPVYKQLRHESASLADVFAFKNLGRVTATIDGQAEPVTAEVVSGNYYSTLDVRPQQGRGIDDADDGAVGSGPVVTISDAFWSKQFGRSPEAIGKKILVNAKPMTIVGVNPRGFSGAYSAQESPDIYFPFSMQPIIFPADFIGETETLLENKTMWWVLMMARLRPGVPVATASAALNVQLNAAVHGTMTVKKENQVPRLVLEDGSRGQNPNADDLTRPVAVLMSLGGFVLLLACANLANLLLARAGARQREMSVRLALGAGRRRIVRQMMTESLLLAAMGGAAGLLLAWAVRNGIPGLMSNGWAPPEFSARFSWPIFAFAATISIVTGLIFGLAPAWQATRVRVSSGLKDAGQTVTHRRRGLAGKSIVVLQVALSMLLVVGAGLFVQTLMRLGRSPLGFRSHNLLLFGLNLPETRFPGTASLPVLQRIEDRVRAVPGVESATLTRVPLMAHNVMNNTVIPQGQQRKPEGNPGALTNAVGRDFFATFGIPILAGRGFTAGDTATAPKAAVVNESFAKQFFPNLSPIGHTFDAGWKDAQTIRIVGVCGDAKYYEMRRAPQPTFYVFYEQESQGLTEATFAVSTHLSGSALLPSLRDAVRSVDSNLPLLDVRTQDEQIAASLQQERIFADLTGGFGVLALILGCIGIYGITAYSVSQRTNEIGIRMALGAQPGRVLRMVLGEAGWMVALGIAAGACGALALGRVIAALLYGVKPYDPPTLAGAASLLIVVALGASWIPARRAAGVDPMKALRHD